MSKSLFSRKETGNLPGTSRLDRSSDTLTIRCIGCGNYPDCSNPACVSCICGAIAENGTAERIRLESTRDTEISGNASEMFCLLARVSRPIVSIPSGRKCARCPRSPQAIIDFAWSGFPDPDFRSACARLYSDRDDGPACNGCMQRTYNALVSAQKEMETVRSKAREYDTSRRYGE